MATESTETSPSSTIKLGENKTDQPKTPYTLQQLNQAYELRDAINKKIEVHLEIPKLH